MSDDKPQRKASEVLLSVEQKLSTVLQLLYNHDMTNKLILNKLNTLSGGLNTITAPIMPPVSTSISAPIEKIIPMQQTPIIRKNIRFENAKETQDIEQSSKKIPVVQRIVDEKGKDLFMAQVEICTQDNESVQKVKSNAIGKWSAVLKPGKYLVKIIKTNTETKQKLESTQEIIIDGTKQSVVLPTAIIK